MEIEKNSAFNLKKELDREREFLKQNLESLKNFEMQRNYLTKDNEFLTKENKELESARSVQQETINSVKTSN